MVKNQYKFLKMATIIQVGHKISTCPVLPLEVQGMYWISYSWDHCDSSPCSDPHVSLLLLLYKLGQYG